MYTIASKLQKNAYVLMLSLLLLIQALCACQPGFAESDAISNSAAVPPSDKINHDTFRELDNSPESHAPSVAGEIPIWKVDFSHAEVPKLPDGWSLKKESVEQGYEAFSEKDRKTGKIVLTVVSHGNNPASNKDEGTISSPAFDVRPYRGKTIEVHGSIITNISTPTKYDYGELWFRTSDDKGSYEHASGHTVFSSGKWRGVSYWMPIRDRDTTLRIGLSMHGHGRVSMDGFSVFDKGKVGRRVLEPASQVENLDLSQGQIGEGVVGWVVGTELNQPKRYDATIESIPGSGRVLLFRSVSPENSEHGRLFQRIDTASYRGKHVAFEADAKFAEAGPDNRVALMLDTNSTAWNHDLADKRHFRTIVGDSWRHYRVELDVDDKATYIDFGAMLMGSGKLWLKNASFQIVGPAGAGNAPAAALTDKDERYLESFARVFGYVRYFYPGLNQSPYWWNNFAVSAVEQVLDRAHAGESLADSLQETFVGIVPNLRVVPESELAAPASGPVSDKADRQPVSENCHWEHRGYGVEANYINSGYASRIICRGNYPDGLAKLPIGSGLVCVLPKLSNLSVGNSAIGNSGNGNSADSNIGAAGSGITGLPAVRFANKPAGWVATGDDRSTRLAAVVVAWNVMQHFYPYFDRSGVDQVGSQWQVQLNKGLSEAAVDKDNLDLYASLRKMIAAVHDDQARVFCADIDGADTISTMYTPDFLFDWVDNKVEIPNAPNLPRSMDENVTDVFSTPVSTVMANHEQVVSAATPQWLHYRALQDILCGSLYSDFSVEDKKSEKSSYSSTVRRYVPFVTTLSAAGIMTTHLLPSRPSPLQEISPGITYVDLTRVSAGQLKKAFPQLAKAQGIVFDCRGELRAGVETFLAHLADKPISSPQFLLPIIAEPNFEAVNFEPVGFTVKPQAPHLKAKAAFLVNESSVGNMESYLMMIQNAKVGTIVGTATAGTAGGIMIASLPGNYSVSWTGIKTLRPDGSKFYGIGIIPDKAVTRTRKAVAEGHDEILDAALAELKR